MPEKTLYDRLGGVFAIAAVIDHFSDEVVNNPIVGQASKNPALREWHTNQLSRLPGLKFMRTLWVCNVAGGPFRICRHEARGDASRLRRSTSRVPNLSRGIRRGSGRAWAHPRLRRRAPAGEGGGSSCLRGTQERGD